jgi:hypothetical protein
MRACFAGAPHLELGTGASEAGHAFVREPIAAAQHERSGCARQCELSLCVTHTRKQVKEAGRACLPQTGAQSQVH